VYVSSNRKIVKTYIFEKIVGQQRLPTPVVLGRDAVAGGLIQQAHAAKVADVRGDHVVFCGRPVSGSKIDSQSPVGAYLGFPLAEGETGQ